MINQKLNTWHGAQIGTLFEEFKRYDDCGELGPWILWLIEAKVTNGRSPFHVRKMRDKFYCDLATDYVARTNPPATSPG